MAAERQTPSVDVIASLPLQEYIALFGPSMLHELKKHNMGEYALKTFALAQKLEKYVDKIGIFERVQHTKQEPTLKEDTSVVRQPEINSPIPTDHMEVGNLTDLARLPNILPSEWSIEEVAPEVFDHRMVSGLLSERQWRETPPPKFVPETKKHAYVLLDISYSMEDYGKQMFSEAVTLAFLRRSLQEGASLHITPFAGYPDNTYKGSTQKELQKMVIQLLKQGLASGTDIAYALAYAVHDIKQEGTYEQADILLLTDGGAQLSHNPLGDINLHTIQIGALSAVDRANGRDGRKTLKKWGKTYQEVSTFFILKKEIITERTTRGERAQAATAMKNAISSPLASEKDDYTGSEVTATRALRQQKQQEREAEQEQIEEELRETTTPNTKPDTSNPSPKQSNTGKPENDNDTSPRNSSSRKNEKDDEKEGGHNKLPSLRDLIDLFKRDSSKKQSAEEKLPKAPKLPKEKTAPSDKALQQLRRFVEENRSHT